MRIGIVYNNKKKEAEKLALNVKKWLEKKEYPVLFGQISEVILKNPDFIITFGGDGFILHVTNKIANDNLIIPLIRANLGNVGALANVEPEEVFDKLQQFLMGNYIIKKRTRITAEVFSNKNSKILIQKIDALNEIVIERIQTRAISFNIYSKEKFERSGDGIIFATQTGSTAYNHAAGGQVLIKDGIVLTVISPSQSEGNFSLVKPVSSTFKIAKIIGEARLVADGKKIMKLSDDKFVIIKKSEKDTYFVEICDTEKLSLKDDIADNEKSLEKLAALEHEQWMEWANSIMDSEDISDERLARWERYFMPYEMLSDEMKEKDRIWARKVLKIIKEEEK